ncbi:MAG: ComEA family DNA-binding protein [Candidatus Tumulicola sp.]
MIVRIGLFAGAFVLVAAALWHPAPRPAFQPTAAPAFSGAPADNAQPRYRGAARARAIADAVVYVAGAVRRAGLYHVHAGDRAADAVAQAGGLSADADAGGVNLAAHVADGDEIDVPRAGESPTQRRSATGSHHRGRHSHRTDGPVADLQAWATGSVDVNVASEDELTRVPGIGAAIAARIVQMRALEGSFHSLDELLDVTGMTQTRLERARPFLRPP